MTKEELIQQIKPYMYCYMGSGMLTDDYDDEVATKSAEKVLEIVSKSLKGIQTEFWLEENGWKVILPVVVDGNRSVGSVINLSESRLVEYSECNCK